MDDSIKVDNPEIYLEFLNNCIEDVFAKKENTKEYKDAINKLVNEPNVEEYFNE